MIAREIAGAARADDTDPGYRRAYVQGWRWGLVCGMCWGALAGAAVVAAAVYLGSLAGAGA